MSISRFGPTRRGGPVFRWLGEPLAVDFANTVLVVKEGEEIDLIERAEDLCCWLEEERSRLGEYRFDPRHTDRMRALRDAVRELLSAAVEGAEAPGPALQLVNAASAGAPVSPQLELGPDGERRSVESALDQGSIEWLLGVLARSAIALLSADEREPLKVCRAPSCGMFFLGARRWCCSACGNRARAARHYSRTKCRRS